MKLYYPVTPWLVSQKFGETAYNSYYKEHGVNFTGHNGVDVVTRHGQPVYAAHDGEAYYEVDSGQGHGVVICSDEGYKTIYWHLCDPKKEANFTSPIYGVKPKSPVKVRAGDLIGYADNTGLSTGDHLHFGIKPIVKNQKGEWGNKDPFNGYMGAIDPTPFWNGKHASDINYLREDVFVGKRGEEVSKLQAILAELGFLTADCITGFFGPKTLSAVSRFQKSTGIFPIAGYVGPKTRAFINGLVNRQNP